MRRRTIRRLLIGVGLLGTILCVVLAYALIWGKLFPFSPIIIGFDRNELPHIVIYIEDNDPYTEFDWADPLVADVEAFHDLTFRWKPKIFFFGDVDTYARRSLSKARLCAFYNGAIVVSPWVQREDAEGQLSLKVYLMHELSHSLLYQNMGPLRRLSYPRWLLEGVAMYSAHQMGTFLYPGREETYTLIREGNWMPPASFGTDQEDRVRLDVEHRMAFIYSEFGCIVGDLISEFGRQAFLDYMKRLLTENDHDAVFRTAFGSDFDAYLTDFRTRVQTGTEQREDPKVLRQ